MNSRHTTLLQLVLAVACLCLPAIAPARTAVHLDPNLIPKFAVPVPIPGSLDGSSTSPGSPLVIDMSEFQQQVLPPAMYPPQFSAGTFVWGYNGSYPGPTIEARRGIPTHVRYVNNLFNPLGGPLFLQQTLTVDRTLHWADPLEEGRSDAPYLGPVPAVVHLHGGEVPSAFDGGPDAWWTPAMAERGPGFVTDTYTYPNEQEAMTMFYHDHALGVTRLNVYAGLAGFYLLRDPANEPANLPGGSADTPLDTYGNPYERGLAIQDRMFDTDGQLYFPAEGLNPEHPYWVPEFFGDVILVNGKPWPYLSVEPRRYRFRLVNGSNARVYKLQLVDATTGLPGPACWQIGSDGGLLDAPVKLNDPLLVTAPELTLAPGERADLIIDFAGFGGQALTVLNDANTPYPDGDPVEPSAMEIMQFRVGPSVTGGVDPSLDPAATATLRTSPIERPARPVITRALTLNEHMGAEGPLEMFLNNTMWAMTPTEEIQVGDTEVWEIINMTADTHPMHLHLFQFQLLERQSFDAAAYMEAYGEPETGMGPPRPYDERSTATGFKLGGNPDVTPFLSGSVSPPDPNETGWKDTFRMNPGEVTRILVRAAPQDAAARAAALLPPVPVTAGLNLFDFEPWVPMGETDQFGYPGGPGYVWHCHIIDHEDNEMMRQLMLRGPDVPTPALVARFEAIPCDGGIRILWELMEPGMYAEVQLERGDTETGPWSRVVEEREPAGRATFMVDRATIAGAIYWYRLVATRRDGSILEFGPIEGETAAITAFALDPVSPSPAPGAMRIGFAVAREADIRLAVFDVRGREVTVLAQGSHEPGRYSAIWDGAGAAGPVPAGIYFVRYDAGSQKFARRVVIVR